MADFQDRYEKQHRDAVRAGAAGRNGEVRPTVSYLKFTEVDPSVSKGVKKAMKKTETKKPKAKVGKLKAKATAKPAASAGQQGPPPKTARQKKLLDIGWQKYEDHMNERWR